MQVLLQTLIGGITFGAVYALVAMGFSIVYRTMGLVNFAHGSVVMIGAYAASTFYMATRLPFALAIGLAIGITGLIGLVIERFLRPLENKDFTLMLIGTIGFGAVLEALAILIWGATGHAVPSGRHRAAQPRRHPHPHVQPGGDLCRRAGDRAAGAVPPAHQARRGDAGGRHGP